MQIFIAADHRGVTLKGEIAEWLRGDKWEVTDLGAETIVPDDNYPPYAVSVAEAVAQDPEQRFGILICGSGAGMAIAANKVRGVRAALIHDPAVARAARHDDNINVVALGADYLAADQAKKVIGVCLTTAFSGEARHQRRLDQITAQEK